MKQSRKIKRVRENPAIKQARSIGVPDIQIHRGNLVICDVANHSDDDQRRMVRSGERQTVRRLTRVEQLAKQGYITQDQLAACSWYADAHELGFQTIGCTANYGGAGGGGFGSHDLLARYKAQGEARENYHYARQAIPAHLLTAFESILFGQGRPVHMLPKSERTKFSMAAWLLHGQVAHLLAIAA